MLRIKLSYNQINKNIKLKGNEEENLDFQELKKLAKKTFQNLPESYKLSYIDMEGDTIEIVNDSDIEMMKEDMEDAKKIKILVFSEIENDEISRRELRGQEQVNKGWFIVDKTTGERIEIDNESDLKKVVLPPKSEFKIKKNNGVQKKIEKILKKIGNLENRKKLVSLKFDKKMLQLKEKRANYMNKIDY